ncbi:MAG: ribonuclease Z [Bacteroidetes bacterium]|nr:MAG: ribonuclease Z [Bacteroidota bacterium]MBL1144398.1 ribonuclease Z [Bacteroidota bacterium]NOG57194.1 ribonuclease Z [Bacteroidota bacterium]
MSFKVLILGNGSALPTISSNQSSQVVEVGNSLFLIDCGEGTQIELRRNKVKIQNLDHIFISHLHGDHFFGLVGLMSTMHLLGRKNELHIHGPKGLDEIIQIQFRNAGSHLSYNMIFHEVYEAGQLLYENKEVKITTIPLMHRIPCFGFLIQEKIKLRKIKVEALARYKIPIHARKSITEGSDYTNEEGQVIPNQLMTIDPEQPKSYAYCSDTAYAERIIEFIEGVDLLYHESTFLESERARAKKTFHSTAADAARIAKQAHVGKLILGHFSNRYKDKTAFLAEAKPIFSLTEIAEEGKEYLV